jgi:hypothetical protein
MKVKKLLNPILKRETGIIPLIFVSLLITIVTFPLLNPVFANGIDPPLSWVFNYLIRGRMLLGKDIIFPHGPLAFVMYPLTDGYNLIIAVAFQFLVRFAFAFSLLFCQLKQGLWQLVKSFIVITILLSLLDLLLVLVGLVIIFSVNYLVSKKQVWLILLLIISSIAIYIKAFVGILCFSVTTALFIIILYDMIFNKADWKVLLSFSLIPILLLIFWLSFYGTFSGLGRYLFGMMQLAGDNSAAVAYYPDNNWWFIAMAFGLLGVITVIHIRQLWAVRYIILVIPAFFATWKYGMAREDYLHAGMFFLFSVFILLLFNLLNKRYQVLTWLFSIITLLLLFLNLRNAYYYEPPAFSFSGIGTLSGLISDYGLIDDTCQAASKRNITRNILDENIRKNIGNSTVDIFPWDYSFIPANNLNWVPRPVLQSYASYTPWLDHENASHFNSNLHPEFIIWELRKITHDIHGGTLESIDGRYLLNDQPEAVLSILANYRLVLKQQGIFPVLVFKKRDIPLHFHERILQSLTSKWNNWIDVPPFSGDLMRVKTKLKRNFLGDLKSFLFKDEACYVYYLLSNNEIRMYRIVPKNAGEGIWINPLLMNGETPFIEPSVKKIMFRCSNPAMMQEDISLNWESISFEGENVPVPENDKPFRIVNHMFGKDSLGGDPILVRSLNDMESNLQNWSPNSGILMDQNAFSGEHCCEIKPLSFSMSYQILLDSICGISEDTSWLLRASIWAKSGTHPDACLVISLECEGKSIAYQAVDINRFLIQSNTWNYVCNYIPFGKNMISTPGTSLKVYVWNKGDIPVYIDDMEVILERWWMGR